MITTQEEDTPIDKGGGSSSPVEETKEQSGCSDEACSSTTNTTTAAARPTFTAAEMPPTSPTPHSPAADAKIPRRVSPTAQKLSSGLRRIPSQIRLAILSLKRDQRSWEDMEDDLFILLDGKLESLQAFQRLFNEMQEINTTQQSASSSSHLPIRSLAYLCSTTAHDMNVRDDHVSKIAIFLVAQRSLPALKLSAVKALITCMTPPEAAWQLQEEVLQGTLEFIVTPGLDWEYMDDHSAMALIYELRARCKREVELEQERIRRVSDRGDEAAILISASAKLVELGIQKSNKLLEGHIDKAGQSVKGWVEVDKDPLIKDRDAVVAMAFSDAAKRASEYARVGTKAAVSNLCDASLSGLQRVGNRLGDQRFSENLSPEGKAALQAAGKVGIAAVGAAAIVGEAIVETSRSVATKTADVTADVVGHKYGVTAGEVAKNAADTADNVFRTIGNAALLDGKLLAKTVARNVGKDQIDKDIDKAKEAIQSFEKNASKLMSQTLGIQWEGNWTKQLGDSSHSTEFAQNQTTEIVVASSEKRDESTAAPKVAKVVEEDNSSEIPSSSLPPRAVMSKLQGQEDQSAGETSSLSSSVSTEVSAISFARRGKPSHRKGILLRPDADPMPSSSSSSRRKSQSTRSRRISLQGQSKAHPRSRNSWA